MISVGEAMVIHRNSNAHSNNRTPRKRRQLPQQQSWTSLAPAAKGVIGGDIEDFGKDEAQKIRVSLLEWYDENKRDLPWRAKAKNVIDEDEGKRAYGVWVSEVMLQQTRVQTVIDYYNRWIQKWPTLEHLSQATLEEVNEMWAGLGYYRRARFLLEGAKMIVDGKDGFPNTLSALRKVRGIGNYTAGAIASIAFREVVPVVDGNVIRVLARLKAISANPKESATVRKFWTLAAQLVDLHRPGDFNQCLMELGATICTPLNPSCSSCPVAGQCRALSITKSESSIRVTDYPTKVKKTKQRHDFAAVSVLEILGGKDGLDENQSESSFILVKRPDKGLLAGLWEFPSVMLDKEANLTTRREAVDNFLKKSFRLGPTKTCKIVRREHVGEFVHVFTHIRLMIYVELFVLHLKGGTTELLKNQCKENMSWKCVDNKSLDSMGLTSGVRKVYTMVQKFKQKNMLTDYVPARKRQSKKLKGS